MELYEGIGTAAYGQWRQCATLVEPEGRMIAGRTNVIAVLCCLLLVVSVVAIPMAAGSSVGIQASASDSSAGDTAADESSTTATQQSDGDDGVADISPALRGDSDVREVVVRLQEPESTQLATAETTGQTIDTLQAHARRTRAPVLEFAKRHDGVTVENTFWLANAVLLELEQGSSALDRLARLDNVERLHENVEVRPPEPVPDATRESKPGSESLPGSPAPNARSERNVTYGLDQIDVPEAWDQFDT